MGNVSNPETDFPFDVDQAVSGGSVEGNPGSGGWDFCIGRFPGLESRQGTTGGASDGESYLHFNSEAVCKLCSVDGTDSQALFLLGEPLRPSRQGLWFDVRTENSSLDAQGVFTFVSAGEICETQAVLEEVDLADFSLSEQWGTRCITVEPAEQVNNLGVFVKGDSFDFYFDALRAGPPCDIE